MSLDKLLDQVKGAILQHVEGGDSSSDVDTGALLNKVESLFGQHADNTGQSLRANDQNDNSGNDSQDNDDQDDDDDDDRNSRQSQGRGSSRDDDDDNDSDDDDDNAK
ncbi:MAG TPA: hypothetical protein VKT32_08245 [Chthonomonadaceae bacterium]|nr:hypothetical protein [Chthonomonadaceae bacterium]